MAVRDFHFVGVSYPAEQFIAGWLEHYNFCEALHEPLHQDHIKQILVCLNGEFRSLQNNLDNDPVLQAYQIEDAMLRIVGWVIKLHLISVRYIKASPDQLPEVG